MHLATASITDYLSPLGPMTMASDGEALVGLWFDGQRHEKAGVKDATLWVFQQTMRWLDLYFSGKKPDFVPPLRVDGSLFKRTVCEIMSEIPYGGTTTYGEIAKEAASRLGKQRMSSQAVGQAVGANPISLIIPCHRVVGSSGSLTGYAGGVERKAALLALEGIDLSAHHLFLPKRH